MMNIDSIFNAEVMWDLGIHMALQKMYKKHLITQN